MRANHASEPTEFQVHPAANLFPMMTAEEYEGLKADIAQHKQRKAITVWNGQLIDGRNRLLGVSPASIKQAKHLIENASQDLIDAVDNGRLSLNAATKLMNGKSVSDSEKPTTEERDKVTKLMQFVRAELQRLSVDERTEATIRILEEMGLPKQTEEQFRAELDRANEPAYIKKIRAEHAKKGAAIKAKYSARMRKMDENWPGFDAQRGEADE